MPGPQQREMQKHFTKQSKLGWGPNKEKCESISPSKASWGGEDETAPYEDEPIKYKLLNIKEAQKVWDIMMS
ncbi:hypothetical protein HMPREF2688_02530 [Staphylococcus sp. HMSC077E12]|nr:hypothetical protein HMPREF2688_02530 [Staphylococcus sp. HMSC077E12]